MFETIEENVLLFKSSFWFLNSGIFLDEEGGVVIDPGYSPEELTKINNFFKEKDVFQKYLIYTHSDFDHITGGEFFPEAEKVAHADFELCHQGYQVKCLMEADIEKEVQRPDFIFPSVSVTFKDRLNLPFKEETLSLVAAPGHTRDSLFVILQNKGVIFSGDTLSDLEFPLIFHSGNNYRDSLKLLGSLVDEYEVGQIVPGHGTMAVGRDDILERLKIDIDYLDNMLDQAESCFYQGLATDEIKAVLKEIQYKGNYIDADLMPVHIKNIELLINEVADY